MKKSNPLKLSIVAIALALIMMLPGIVQGQDRPSLMTILDLQTMDFNRFGAYLSSSSLMSTVFMGIEAQRENGLQTARIKFSSITRIIEEEEPLYEFPLTTSRIEFLAPEEVAGDVYLVESARRVRSVLFWNPNLTAPIDLDANFEIFGDANVFSILGYRLSEDYLPIGAFGRYVDGKIVPQPETTDEILFIGRRIRVIENRINGHPERVDFLPYPKIRLFSYNYMLPYKIELMDDDENVLSEIHYPNWRSFEEVETPQGFTRSYMNEFVIVNPLIPGNTTRLLIDRVEYDDVNLDLFDPSKLGTN